MANKLIDGLYKPRKSKKNVYGRTVQPETLALKSSNIQVFEEISNNFEKLLLSDEFKDPLVGLCLPCLNNIVDKAAA